MLERSRGQRTGPLALLVAIVAMLGLGACGSSSSGASGESAQTLLQQTFASGHTARSGVLDFGLVVNPVGSATITQPVSLSLSGPFQSRGSGKVPASDLTISFAALGKQGSLGVISTGTAGYVTLQGAAYQLPASDVAGLQSSLSAAESTSGQKSSLSALGIDPLGWLRDPRIVGTPTIAGTATTHIRAGVDVTAFLAAVNRILAKAAASGAAGTSKLPKSIPPAAEQTIAADVRDASVDVWTGSNDKTLRKLVLSLSLPVSGQISTTLGGMRSAGITLTLQYAQLNQPQTITAPSHVQPYAELTTKIASLSGQLGGLVGGGGLGTASAGAGNGSTTKIAKYTACLQKANGNVKAMQKCEPLLNGGG